MLHDAIVKSCDIYFYQLGRLIGIDTLHSRAIQFGFGQKTGIDLPHEKPGCLPDRAWMEKCYGENWTAGHMFNLSIGQGDLLITPLQLACAYSAIANNGTLVTPFLLKGAHQQQTEVQIDAQILAIVRTALHDVVLSGTGQLARVQDCYVCGKTGTIQNPHGEDHSVFVGYAPSDNAEIVVCVFVENAGHGGSIAAPISGAIVRSYMNLQKSRDYAQTP